MTYLAAPLAAPSTGAALQQARSLVGVADLVEYRLDAMDDFDLPRLVAETPLPAIITCRSRAQGGHFRGSEKERLAILQQALALQPAFVDVEMDALASLPRPSATSSRIIGSWHAFSNMGDDWGALGMKIRAWGADVVKLVGMAASEDDILIPLHWLHQQHGAAIGLAMGEAGVLTRLLAPRFPQALLSFGAAGIGTAAGQISLSIMLNTYHFRELATAYPLLVVLGPNAAQATWLAAYQEVLQEQWPSQKPLLLPLPCHRLSTGVWLSLVLARVQGVILQPDLLLSDDMQLFGPLRAGACYRLDGTRAVVVSYERAPATRWRFPDLPATPAASRQKPV